MKTTIAIALTLVSVGAHAIERKSILDVDVAKMTGETQVIVGTADSLDLVWWIPVEYWEANLRQNDDVPAMQVDQMLGVLRQYSVLAVVQADISSFGAFHFYDKEKVMNGMTVQAIDSAGEAHTIPHTEPSDPDMRLLLDQMRPVLAQAIGNMGQSLFFFPLPAADEAGERRPSPYENGKLRVTLERGDEELSLEIETPLDSLFVPRMCPNGRPAHVSWTYCPWSGKKLKD